MAPTAPSSPSTSSPPPTGQDIPSPLHSLPNDADDLLESFCPDEPFDDNSDNSDESGSRVISVSEQSNRPSYSNPGGHTEDKKQTNTLGRSGSRPLTLASKNGRKRL